MPGVAEASPSPSRVGSASDAVRLRQLKKLDQAVERHEQAHRIAGGPYTGPATFTYKTGPDGRPYAIAGEVRINASPVPDNLEATVAKMRVVIAAALAPVDPSPQDRSVAARASQRLQEASTALRRESDEAVDAYGEPPARGAAIDETA
ncbi:MAG: putative metalloprotease CJM1_0395 family protein [Sinimarinibacterium sp.]|jgi:hypothetical protein